MKEVTIEQVLSFGPCYGYNTREELLAISGGRESMPLLDILRIEQIPVPDRLWLALRKEFISEKDLHLLACKAWFAAGSAAWSAAWEKQLADVIKLLEEQP